MKAVLALAKRLTGAAHCISNTDPRAVVLVFICFMFFSAFLNISFSTITNP